MMIALLLAVNVASLGYVCRDKIRAALTRTVYVCTLDDIEDRHETPSRQQSMYDDTTRLEVYREILQATGLDYIRQDAGARMLACQSLHMRGVLLTTGLRPFVTSLKKSDDATIRNYITRNGSY